MVALNSDQFGKPYFPQRGADKGPSTGVQGKLFRDPKPVDAARYQRGYTPERMQEVQGANIEIKPVAPRRGVKAGTDPFSDRGGAHRIKQVIARSTTPVSDFKPRFNGDRLKIQPASPDVKRNTAAHYRYSQIGGFGEVHLGRDSSENSQGQYLMHELGHARSESEGTSHTRPETRAEWGKEEAFADDNMMSRWRPDPRDVRRGKAPGPKPSYEHDVNFKGQVPSARTRMTGGKTAHKAYLAARTTPIVKTKTEREWQARRKDASFQPPMVAKFGGKEVLSEHALPAGPAEHRRQQGNVIG